MCALSMALFFVIRARDAAGAEVAVQMAPQDTLPTVQETQFSELEYYNQQADEYLSLLPSDKRVIATLVDSLNHHIVYYETSQRPSCYSYDLESLTTEVLFGGADGFYCDTKLLIIGTIHEWRQSGDWVWFIADNRAPEADVPNAIVVFALNLFTHQLHYFAHGSAAGFDTDGRLILQQATLLYHSLFTGENVYDYSNTLYDI